MKRRRRSLLACLAPLLVFIAGCPSPEATRTRGGGAGGDGGNYPSKPIAIPSKLDGSKNLTRTWDRHESRPRAEATP